MTLAEALLSLLLKYHAGRVAERYWGESHEARRERLGRIAASNIRACHRVKLPSRWTPGGCLALLTVAEEWESGLERSVHEGHKRGPAGEACLVQLHPSVYRERAIHDPDYQITKEEWESLPGLDEEATDRCAKRSCSGCVDRCMDMDMEPYCVAVDPPWGRFLSRGRPVECGERYLLWQKDIRSSR